MTKTSKKPKGEKKVPEKNTPRPLLEGPPRVINIGLSSFADDLSSSLLPGATIREANSEAVKRMLEAEPVLVDVVMASEAIPDLEEGMILHAGPPIDWDRMCGPMRGAVAGIAVFEGWAENLSEAEHLAESGAFKLRPNHDYGAVGPMTGMTTLSQPVLVVENRSSGNRAYCTINEGLGKVMRFGGNDASVIKRLGWLRDKLGPAMGAALRSGKGIELKPLVARGLTMGDEMHQRNVGCSSLLLRALAPELSRNVNDRDELTEMLAFIGSNDQFFLNVAMVLGKAIMDPVRNIEGSSVVTAMSRNGTDFGIRVSGLGEEWFTAPVEMPEGLYFPGFSVEDANPDMGDSTIVETIGLGGFAMAASPAVAGFVGAGTPSSAADFTRIMGEITLTTNPEWTIPALDYQGVPTGIDIRLVVETGIVPTINTGIAHRKPGIGQVGAGVVKAPLECFEKALRALALRLGI